MMLAIYPIELNIYIYIRNCSPVLIAALFISTKTLKQPRCTLIDEWVNKLWYIHAREYYLVIKGNELSSHEKTWRNFKCVLLSEKSQSERLHTELLQLYDILETAEL